LTLFGEPIFAAWAVDYGLAFLFGIAFQFFAFRPMTSPSAGAALLAALKAVALSLPSWQIGMYRWMALAVFVIFGHELLKTSPAFWFMMRIAGRIHRQLSSELVAPAARRQGTDVSELPEAVCIIPVPGAAHRNVAHAPQRSLFTRLKPVARFVSRRHVTCGQCVRGPINRPSRFALSAI
jgi:hypothetical protein